MSICKGKNVHVQSAPRIIRTTNDSGVTTNNSNTSLNLADLISGVSGNALTLEGGKLFTPSTKPLALANAIGDVIWDNNQP